MNMIRLSLSILAGSSLATAAIAQSTESAPAKEAQQLEEVVVTGSRLTLPGLASASPVSVVTAEEIQESGQVGIEAVLNNMPQVFGAQSQQLNNAGGVATANLRGLGPTRTLVLVDGRRLMPGDPTAAAYAPDLNNIPSELVERVDVVTGGASAVYGSDAVAGVVNFIMKKNFQGVQIGTQYGFSNHTQHNDDAQQAIAAYNALPTQQALLARGVSGVPTIPGNVGADAKTRDFSVILGTNFADDKGNITGYATYRHLDPVLASTRDFSDCTIGSTGAGGTFTQHVCTGGNLGPGGFFSFRSPSPAVGQQLTTNTNGTSTFIPYSAATMGFSISQYNYMQRDDTVRTAGFFAHYDANEHAEIYSDFMFASDDTVGALAPQGLQATNNPAVGFYTINCANPLISAAQRTQICGTAASVNATISYRLTGYQQSSFAYGHNDYKVDTGVRGDIADGWKYDAYVQYGAVSQSARNYPLVSVNRTQRALDVVSVGGVATCNSVINGTDPNCVPLNIFSFNGPSQAAINYVSYTNSSTGYTRQSIVSGSVTGELGRYGLKSPVANDGLGVAAGYEFRQDSLGVFPDSAALLGEGGTFGVAPAPQTISVKEEFVELGVPLVQDRFLLKDLSFQGGYRSSDYTNTNVGRVSTYKLALQYSPVSDIRFRGGFNRAVRAPNMLELFAAQAFGITTGSDGCAGTNPSQTLAQCQQSGVTAAQYGSGSITQCPSNSCRALNGGNPDLKPEVADSKTFGVILQPRFAPDLSVTLDYYDIKVTGVIVNPAGSALTNCANTGLAFWCGLIHRDPVTGQVSGGNGYLTATLVNAGYFQTKGLDVQANYGFTLPRGWGGLNVSLTGTKLNAFVLELQPGTRYDCAGLYGFNCNSFTRAPLPSWRDTLRTSWKTPWQLNITANWRHISAMSLDGNESNPALARPYNAIDARISAYDYLDLSVDTTRWKHLTLRAGIRNVFDRDPPLLDTNNQSIAAPASFGSLNTYPALYDVLGRSVFVGATAEF